MKIITTVHHVTLVSKLVGIKLFNNIKIKCSPTSVYRIVE